MMRICFYILAVFTLTLACAETARTPSKSAYSEKSTGLTARMAAIGKVMESQGFSPAPWAREGMIDAGDQKTFFMHSKKQDQIVLAAIGDNPELDIDIEVTSRSGRQVVSDVTENLRAVLVWIADPEEEYSIELGIKKGNGKFLLQAFSAPTSTPTVKLTGFFDADPGSNRSFDTVKKRMDLMGYKLIRKPEKLAAKRRDKFSFPIQLVNGQCYMFAAQGSAGIDHLDLRLEEQRRLIVTDLSGRPEAWTRHCAEKDMEARLIIGIAAGSGTITYGAFSARRRDVEERVGPRLFVVEHPQTLEDRVHSMEHTLNDMGYSKGEVLFDSEMLEGSREETNFSLEQDECAALYFATYPGLTELDIEVFANGEEISTAERSPGILPSIGICADAALTYRAELIALAGHGKARMILARLPRQDLPDLADPVMTFIAQEASALFRSRGLKPFNAPIEMQLGNRPNTFETRIELSGNKCYGLAVISYGPINRATVRDDSEKEVSIWNGPGSPALIAICPLSDQVYDIAATVSIRGVTPNLLVFVSDLYTGTVRGYP